MKILIFATLLLAGCASDPIDPQPMQGEKVDMIVKGQFEMCIREPESVLCQDE